MTASQKAQKTNFRSEEIEYASSKLKYFEIILYILTPFPFK